jgi:hypothetical protein
MIRNTLNLNIQNEEIALLQARLRITAEKLKQENDNRLLTFPNNAQSSSSSSNAKPNVLQDISNNQTSKARRARRANKFNTFGTVQDSLNFLASKFVKSNKRK